MNVRRTMRADARRNYENLLAKASEVIEESGTAASLEEIARRAGVGIGTLYRHFPTRDTLLEALLHMQFEELRLAIDELLSGADPEAAVTEGLRQFVTHSITYRGLVESMVVALNDESSQLYAACHAVQDSAYALVERAQREGVIRPDLEASDLYGLVYGVAFVAEHDPLPAKRIDRLISLLLDGIRPPPKR